MNFLDLFKEKRIKTKIYDNPTKM